MKYSDVAKATLKRKGSFERLIIEELKSMAAKELYVTQCHTWGLDPKNVYRMPVNNEEGC